VSQPRPPDDPEVPLTGGTLGPVVRIGDTVRRTAGPWTPTIHELLRHIRARGFSLAPEPLGVEEAGREVLRFIPGTTIGWQLPWPEAVRRDDLLAEFGRAVAAYHRAVADFRPTGPVPWQSGLAALGPDEIVCHHDLAPYNVVLDGDNVAGIIDWDLAAPGTSRFDLAFVAWQWVPLHGPQVTRRMGWNRPPDRAARLRLLLDAYGLQDRRGFVDEVLRRISYNRHLMVRRAAEGSQAYQQLIQRGHLRGMDEASSFLTAQRDRLQATL
jgi:hypothetical protein